MRPATRKNFTTRRLHQVAASIAIRELGGGIPKNLPPTPNHRDRRIGSQSKSETWAWCLTCLCAKQEAFCLQDNFAAQLRDREVRPAVVILSLDAGFRIGAVSARGCDLHPHRPTAGCPEGSARGILCVSTGVICSCPKVLPDLLILLCSEELCRVAQNWVALQPRIWPSLQDAATSSSSSHAEAALALDKPAREVESSTLCS